MAILACRAAVPDGDAATHTRPHGACGRRAAPSIVAAVAAFNARLGQHDGEAVASLAFERRWPLRELRRDDKTMEQVFREVTAAHSEVSR